MRNWIAVLAVGLAAAWPLPGQDTQPKNDTAREEQKKLQGTWKIVSAESMGKAAPVKDTGIDTLVIKDDKVVFSLNGKLVKILSIVLDPTKKPKTIDLLNLEMTGSIAVPGIYELAGDELKICVHMLPKKGTAPTTPIERPTSFDTKDRPYGLLVAKRDKS